MSKVIILRPDVHERLVKPNSYGVGWTYFEYETKEMVEDLELLFKILYRNVPLVLERSLIKAFANHEDYMIGFPTFNIGFNTIRPSMSNFIASSWGAHTAAYGEWIHGVNFQRLEDFKDILNFTKSGRLSLNN